MSASRLLGESETREENGASAPLELDWFRRLHVEGGPGSGTCPPLEGWIRRVAKALDEGSVTRPQLDELFRSLGPSYVNGTIQGCAYEQPFGYAGDFQTIDRIYTRVVSSDPLSARWDRYFHAQSAPNAVRNRKEYFKSVLRRLEERENGEVRVLDLGSGPCRDVLEYLNEAPRSRASFTCVDQDPAALEFGRQLCRGHEARVEFVEANVLRYRAPGSFSLVWSAGVMDYLDERLAIRLLGRMIQLAGTNGEVVAGNFSRSNPSRDYMEVVGCWYLHHRSESDLFRLIAPEVADSERVRIGREPSGVNLFLHVLPPVRSRT